MSWRLANARDLGSPPAPPAAHSPTMYGALRSSCLDFLIISWVKDAMKSGKGYLTESSLKSSTPLVSHNLPASNSGKTTCPNEISKASLRRSTGESRNHCTLGFRQTFLFP